MPSLNRRRFLAASAGLMGASAWPACTLADEKPATEKPKDESKLPPSKRTRQTKGMITAKARSAIYSGLDHLAKVQIKSGREKGCFGVGGHSANVAVTGLAGLAFMCSGSHPGEGPYGRNVDRCIDFILRYTSKDGYIARPPGSDNMYGHGFATLFLAEAYGMSKNPARDKAIAAALKSSINLIAKTQSDAGGWRYRPVKSDADLSITICQIMALRAARDAGLTVPEKTRKKCIEYVKNSRNSDGGFRYTIHGGGSTFPLTAAGLVSLYSAGIYSGEIVDKGLKWLIDRISVAKSFGGGHWFYGNYYAVQAMWHAGGKYWGTWYPAIRETLISNQQRDGTWYAGHGSEYATAMSCIILQMPNNYVPVFHEG